MFSRAEDDFVGIWEGTRQAAGVVLRDPKPDEPLTRFSVRLATLNKLVELATSPPNPAVPEEAAAQQHFLSVFILTHRSFVSPDLLLRKLIDRFNVPAALVSSSADPAAAAHEAAEIRRCVCNFTRLWFRLAYSSIDPETISLLYAFAHLAAQYAAGLSREDRLWAIIRLLEKTIEKKFADPSFTLSPAARRFVPRHPPPFVLPHHPAVPWSQLAFLDVDALEFARQLTAADFQIYAQIQPSEFFNLAWSNPALQHNAPHISAFISRFNLVSAMASGLVLSSDSVRQRALVFERLVAIALHLRALGNFHSLMAVVGAFSNAAVKRLKATAALVGPRVHAALAELRDLLSPFQSFRRYRAEYAAARGPAIPFIGSFLTDLTYIEDGNKNDIDGMINFGKRSQSYAIIQDVLKFTASPYELAIHPELQAFIARLPKFSDEELYQRSLEFEPREAAPASTSRERGRRLELPFSQPVMVSMKSTNQSSN